MGFAIRTSEGTVLWHDGGWEQEGQSHENSVTCHFVTILFLFTSHHVNISLDAMALLQGHSCSCFLNDTLQSSAQSSGTSQEFMICGTGVNFVFMFSGRG
jgi:hypothetical protein